MSEVLKVNTALQALNMKGQEEEREGKSNGIMIE